MLRRLIGHVRSNVVAYTALMVAVISGGGGYAFAATTHHQTKHHKKTTIVACASKRSGELFLHHRGRCAKGRHKVRWSIKGPRGKKGATGAAGAAGAPAPSIFAAVDAFAAAGGAPNPFMGQGMTVVRTAVGTYAVTITDATCGARGTNVATVTPTAYDPEGGLGEVPVAFLDNNSGSPSFTVHVGYVNTSGTFVPTDYSFNVQDTCQP